MQGDDNGGATTTGSGAEAHGAERTAAGRPERRRGCAPGGDGGTTMNGGCGCAAGRPVDRALALLLLAAEREVRMPVTVNVGGVMISGTLVGTRGYLRAIADQFTPNGGGTGMDEGLAEAFRDLMDDQARVAGGDRRTPPDPEAYARCVCFLHLDDARYVSEAGILPHGRRGMLWRCAVGDITGWSLGELLGR